MLRNRVLNSVDRVKRKKGTILAGLVERKRGGRCCHALHLVFGERRTPASGADYRGGRAAEFWDRKERKKALAGDRFEGGRGVLMLKKEGKHSKNHGRGRGGRGHG